MPDNIPLDSEVDGTIVYPLSDETGVQINETLDTGLGQICVKLDNGLDVITLMHGVFEQIYQALLDDGYELPTATDTVLGGVKIDGVTIQIRNGVISVVNPLEYMDNETIVSLTPFIGPPQSVEDQVYVAADRLFMMSADVDDAIGVSVSDGYVHLNAPTDVVEVFNDMLQIYTDGPRVK